MRILELEFHTRWLDKVADFYGKTLGFEVLQSSASRFSFRIGWTAVTFLQDDSGEAPWYHFAINVPPNQLEDAQALITRTQKLLTNDRGSRFFYPFWKAEAIYIADPSGNIVELIARHGVGEASHKPFDAGSLLCVSEIGLPVVEFDALDRSLRRQLGVQHYLEPTGSFSVLGDGEGSIILVRDERPWEPSNREAEVHPLRIKLGGVQEAHVTFAALPYQVNMERII
jgi:catechol 2,3-dioxygenase-like lactoylglutathione lyase family enzyme